MFIFQKSLSAKRDFFALLFFGAFPLKLLFHYIIGPRNKNVPLDMMLIYIFNLEVLETSLSKTSKQLKKSAAEGGRLLRLFFRLLHNQFLEVQK